jgi:hypothetical protein
MDWSPMDKRSLRAPIVMLLAAALGGCADETAPTENPDPGPTGPTTPAAAVEEHARSMEAKDFDAYAALLAPDFQFFPRDDDVQDFPWIAGDSWGLEDELGMIGNMMDPGYNGQEPPVDAIEFAYAIRNERVPEEGIVELTVDCDITVLASPQHGWFADTRLIFVLVRDADGFYQIRSIREVQVLAPRESAEEFGWGSVKNLYR